MLKVCTLLVLIISAVKSEVHTTTNRQYVTENDTINCHTLVKMHVFLTRVYRSMLISI